ncbi:MAG TPA: N-acetylmuramoyl-L-alanine amidase [Candidatus Fusicatenibacter merdavium]|uniref:N-acetylmuramoyl-L-alanine amidase n=1 Tax=Candidatus Fusicatenibacter merdavium TaxID=2838600 RepID=A0A9D1XEP2_9FIRM|nr:N-acetylmuramoyl-L-alanine amidase [Candidatus Fusicatenibacter merdavium]
MTRKRRRAQVRRRVMGTVAVVGVCVLGLGFGVRQLTGIGQSGPVDIQADTTSVQWEGAPPINVELLTPNEWSRPQIALQQINGIVIHYTANPGSTAQQNHDYFEGLKDSQSTKASSHFIIGLDGEVIQCIPSSEWAYASNSRNSDTLSIECCHPDESGQFTDATYQSLVQLTGWLCHRFGLSSEDVIRHYDVTGKDCPKYFVEHEDAWVQFRQDVQDYADSL